MLKYSEGSYGRFRLRRELRRCFFLVMLVSTGSKSICIVLRGMDGRRGEKDLEFMRTYDGFIALINTRGRHGFPRSPDAVSCLYS
jgi:hypothetical protein